jgi:hypothetical protein
MLSPVLGLGYSLELGLGLVNRNNIHQHHHLSPSIIVIVKFLFDQNINAAVRASSEDGLSKGYSGRWRATCLYTIRMRNKNYIMLVMLFYW